MTNPVDYLANPTSRKKRLETQALFFSEEHFPDIADVRKWIVEHRTPYGYYSDIHTRAHTGSTLFGVFVPTGWSVAQKHSFLFDQESFRVRTLAPGVQALVGRTTGNRKGYDP